MGRRTGIANIVATGLVTTAACLYGLHVGELAPSVGFALFLSFMALVFATIEVPPRVQLASSAVVVALGLGTVWVIGGSGERVGRILRDLAWAQALLGAWMTYSCVISASLAKPLTIEFDDASRAKWRGGDIGFGADLAGRIVVRAQPSWAALVVETAWPSPRPERVEELVKVLASASPRDIAALKEGMHGKGGTDAANARWELARIACDVVVDARGRDDDDIGGAAAGLLIIAAAKTVRDDDDATRIFAALVLPAVARRA